MIQFLVFTEEHANVIREDASGQYRLNPIRLTDGRYILPLRVLDAIEHNSKKTYLEQYSTIEEIDPALFPQRSRRNGN